MRPDLLKESPIYFVIASRAAAWRSSFQRISGLLRYARNDTLRLNCFFQLSLAALLLTAAGAAPAAPNLNGETGLINMPDGRIEADGTFRMGYSFADPYSALWTSVTILPRVEMYGRFTRIMHTPHAAAGTGWENYGDYKDKVFSTKVLLLEEDWSTPSVVFGVNDLLGTQLFPAKYLAASKQFGALDATVGIGSGRIQGPFAGARYAPKDWSGFGLVAEYDANNYAKDYQATASGVNLRKKGVGVGVEYRWGWLGSQLAWRDGKPTINAYGSVPLNMKEFVPKIDEPAPDTKIVERVPLAQWQSDPGYRSALVSRLLQQDFRNIHLQVEEGSVEAALTNTRISLPTRAVGRASRTLLLRAPLGTQRLVIHYTVNDMPFATYTFEDANRLQRYFNGLESRKQLAETVKVSYASGHGKGNHDVLDAIEEEYVQVKVDGDDGDYVSLRAGSSGLGNVRVAPGVGIYFNDPSGIFRYELFASARYEKRVTEQVYFKTAAQLMLNQDISQANAVPANLLSPLPHVRTDLADYKKNGSIKLTQMLLNKYYQPDERIYARASAGLYEEMFGGAGGQVLYFPERSPWAADITVDALKQRDVGGGFAFRPYQTVSALAALHYRLPIPGLTATVRGGRFLAQDLGARFEVKRRFLSGIEVGAWYSFTNGNDTTAPGAGPGHPYHDKGIFATIPLEPLLTRDTQAGNKMSLATWTRDVGQMVQSPDDLYDRLESANLNLHDRDGLEYFGDLNDSYDMPRPANVVDRSKWSMKQDAHYFAAALKSKTTWAGAGIGLGLVALSATVDKPADAWAVRRSGSRVQSVLGNVGNNLPLLVGGVSGLLALDENNPRLSGTAFTALEAAVAGVIASEAGKRIVGRSRPQAGMGGKDFHPMTLSGGSGFPSGHTTAMWALVTPYAKEYNAPWLYGAAMVTNLARVVDRKHFVSDTVAGSLLGYAIGSALWGWHRDQPQLVIDRETVGLSWQMN